MTIELRTRLHDVSIMLHGPRPGGQYCIETYAWDTDTEAFVPGSGQLSLPIAIAFDAGDDGTAWKTLRDLIDVALVDATNVATARAAEMEQQRDRANSERDAAMATATKAVAARDAALIRARNAEARAAEAVEAGRRGVALTAEVAEQGT